jgi:hypothetical protein
MPMLIETLKINQPVSYEKKTRKETGYYLKDLNRMLILNLKMAHVHSLQTEKQCTLPAAELMQTHLYLQRFMYHNVPVLTGGLRKNAL